MGSSGEIHSRPDWLLRIIYAEPRPEIYELQPWEG